MKILATYTGKILKFNAPPALSYVVLKEEATGKVTQTDAVTEKLMEAGLQQDDCFEIIIQESLENKVVPIMRKIDQTTFDI